MRAVPNLVAGERPRRADADHEVRPQFIELAAGKRDRRADQDKHEGRRIDRRGAVHGRDQGVDDPQMHDGDESDGADPSRCIGQARQNEILAARLGARQAGENGRQHQCGKRHQRQRHKRTAIGGGDAVRVKAQRHAGGEHGRCRKRQGGHGENDEGGDDQRTAMRIVTTRLLSVAGGPPACAKDRTHRLDRRSAARFKAAARRNSDDYGFGGASATGASTLTSGLRSIKLTAR